MNPYEATVSAEIARKVVHRVWPRTYLQAGLIAALVGLICPVYLTALWQIRLKSGALDYALHLAIEYLMIAIPAILIGMLCVVWVPHRLSNALSDFRHLMALAINTISFSTMFSLMGYGYLRGYVSIYDYDFSPVVIFNAIIVANTAFMHLAFRPAA